MKFSTSVAGCALAALVHAAPEHDRVTSLPEMGNFDEYGAFSGYLPIEGTSKQIHYLFFEAQENAKDAPVLIWFNGGPGCSSMLGMMQELGPVVVDDGERYFKTNPHPWNERANVLFLESPAGVGWSWAGTDADLDTNDMIQSHDAITALKSWFKEYPEFLPNELYVSGESYGGIYVPYLAW